MTINTVLADAWQKLEAVSHSPQLDCQILLAYALNRSRDWLYSHAEDEIPETSRACFQTLINRRVAGEPVAYIVGTRGFWNREFKVNASVLVPRPETELLVETLLDRLDQSPRDIADLGTGSGAIAVSLAAERPAWQLLGIDASKKAIETACSNAEDLDNITFRVGNWCESLAANSFDAIVSNPPYIRQNDEHLKTLAHEPISALTSGTDGMDDIRVLVPQSFNCMKPGGMLIVEHGYDQQQDVCIIFQDAGFVKIEPLNDLSGTPRSVLGYKP